MILVLLLLSFDRPGNTTPEQSQKRRAVSLSLDLKLTRNIASLTTAIERRHDNNTPSSRGLVHDHFSIHLSDTGCLDFHLLVRGARQRFETMLTKGLLG
jgi:hypothetical protein